MALDTLKLENYVNEFYKDNADEIFEHEAYKIRAMQDFQKEMGQYLADDSDNIAEFSGKMDNAVSRFYNLLSMGRLDGADCLKQCASLYRMRMYDALQYLYRAGRENDALGGIEFFNTEFRSMVKEFVKLSKPSNLTDTRVPALLVFFLFPEKYFFFKQKQYDAFRKLISYAPVRGKSDYINCQLMSAEILEVVKKDKALLEQYEERVMLQLPDEVSFKEFDPEYHMLVQDIIWSKWYYENWKKYDTILPPDKTPKPRIDEFIDDPKIFYPGKSKKTGKSSVGRSGGVDYLAEQISNSELGERGEEFVLRHERKKIKAMDPKLLKDYPRHMSRETKDTAGYDILSLNDEGKEIYIEVKTTKYEANTAFYFTNNELEFSVKNAGQYRLYRVFHFKDDEGDLYKYRGSLENFCGQPVLYCVKMDKKKSKK